MRNPYVWLIVLLYMAFSGFFTNGLKSNVEKSNVDNPECYVVDESAPCLTEQQRLKLFEGLSPNLTKTATMTGRERTLYTTKTRRLNDLSRLMRLWRETPTIPRIQRIQRK